MVVCLKVGPVCLPDLTQLLGGDQPVNGEVVGHIDLAQRVVITQGVVLVLIDATVIRSVLLPASMKLLGDANWYLPRRLDCLPKIEMAE